ncbi:hypothetical protein D3C84_1237730 [compost metagenome]
MNQQVCFSNINWDTDGVDADLPASAVLEVYVGDDTDLGLEGADILSDEFGNCVFSFDFEVLEPSKAKRPGMSM